MKGGIGSILIVFLAGLLVISGVAYYFLSGNKVTLPNANTTLTNFSDVSPTNPFAFNESATAPPQATPTANPNSPKCEDNTSLDTCNSKRQACRLQEGAPALQNDCTACGCPAGLQCNPVSRLCIIGCDDGTPLSTCSNATDKYYCDSNAQLVLNGTACGCPIGYQYDPYGSGPDVYNDCKQNCRSGVDCNSGK